MADREPDEQIVACKEALPLQARWSRPAARRLVAEATLIEQMVRLDDGAPWRMAMGEWLTRVKQARTLAMRPTPVTAEGKAEGRPPGTAKTTITFDITLPADPVEALRLLQLQVRGCELPTALVQAICSRGMDAQVQLNAEDIAPPAAPRLWRQPKDLPEAAYWREQAMLAAKLVETAGWDVLMRSIAARMWTVVELKTICPPEMGPFLDALVKAFLAPINAIQKCIDLGYVAEAWFEDQVREAKE